MMYSRDGRRMATVSGSDVTISDAVSGTAVSRIGRPGVLRLSFSPLASYLVTWERWQKPSSACSTSSSAAADAAADADATPPNATKPAPAPAAVDNLCIWSVESGELVASFQQKVLGVWYGVQWLSIAP
jgi:uncharacterized protein with WD repeat